MASSPLAQHPRLLLLLSGLGRSYHLRRDPQKAHTLLCWAADQLFLIVLDWLPNFDVTLSVQDLLMGIAGRPLVHLCVVCLCCVRFIPVVLLQELYHHVYILGVKHHAQVVYSL